MKRGGGKKRESVAAKCLSLSLSISLSISLCSLQGETVIIQRVDGAPSGWSFRQHDIIALGTRTRSKQPD